MNATITDTTAPTSRPNRRRRLVAGLVLTVAVLAAGCSEQGGQRAEPRTDGTSEQAGAERSGVPESPLSVADGEGSSTGATEPGDRSIDTGVDVPTGASSDPAPTAQPQPEPHAQPQATPTFTSVDAPDDIDCHNGDFQQFTLSWATAGADRVTISIDGPGVYDTYGPVGSASLPFSCSSAHTFLLTAYGPGGQTSTRSVTLQPRNVQPSGGDAADAGNDVEDL